MRTLRIALPSVPVSDLIVKIAGWPTSAEFAWPPSGPATVMLMSGRLRAEIVILPVGALAPPPTRAVTSALTLVVSVVRASPASFVSTVLCASWPAVVEKFTGAPRSGLPPVSSTVAIISVDPPVEGTTVLSARTDTTAAAAAPTRISRSSDLLPPENAPILAEPDCEPAM